MAAAAGILAATVAGILAATVVEMEVLTAATVVEMQVLAAGAVGVRKAVPAATAIAVMVAAAWDSVWVR